MKNISILLVALLISVLFPAYAWSENFNEVMFNGTEKVSESSDIMSVIQNENNVCGSSMVYTDSKQHDVTVYLKDPGWEEVYLYSWDYADNKLSGEWPGTKMIETKEIDGEKWYFKTFTVNGEDYKFNIIFNQGNGKGQTRNIEGLNSDKYYEIGDFADGFYNYKDVTPGKSDFEPYDVTVYLKDPGWEEVYFYSWGYDGNPLGDVWPGTKMTETKEIDGEKWYFQTFTIKDEDYKFNIIFNPGNGKGQTNDITGINSDKYYEIDGCTDGKFSYKDVTPGKSDFEPYDVTVYLKDPGWNELCFYAWDNNGTLLGDWPGLRIIDSKMIDGEKWFYHVFSIPEENYAFNIIFDAGSGNMQTVDILGISTDKFFEIGEMENGKYLYNEVEIHTGIDNMQSVENNAMTKVYSINGQMLREYNGYVSDDKAVEGLTAGIYIVNGKKYIK